MRFRRNKSMDFRKWKIENLAFYVVSEYEENSVWGFGFFLGVVYFRETTLLTIYKGDRHSTPTKSSQAKKKWNLTQDKKKQRKKGEEEREDELRTGSLLLGSHDITISSPSAPVHFFVRDDVSRRRSFCSFRPDEDQGNPGRNVDRLWKKGVLVLREKKW